MKNEQIPGASASLFVAVSPCLRHLPICFLMAFSLLWWYSNSPNLLFIPISAMNFCFVLSYFLSLLMLLFLSADYYIQLELDLSCAVACVCQQGMENVVLDC